MNEEFGKQTDRAVVVHAPHPVAKQVGEEIEQRFHADLEDMRNRSFRDSNDLQFDFVNAHVGKKLGKTRLEKSHSSSRLLIVNNDSLEDPSSFHEAMSHRATQFICLNDDLADPTREQVRALTTLLDDYFPNPVDWEV